MVCVVFSYGPSCLNIRADQSSLTGRLVLAYGPTCLGPSCPRAELSGTPFMKGEECPFCLNLTSFPTFLTLQDKHNIRTLSLNIKYICTRCETGLKSSPKLAILPVSKARTNKFYIYRQCTYIVYLKGSGFVKRFDLLTKPLPFKTGYITSRD